jgi:hypothetical protein
MISNIAKELEILAAKPHGLGLRNGGLTGISLFFFHYARFTGDERYVELANDSIEKAISIASRYMSYYSASEFANIGRTVELLANEKFIEIEADEFAGYFGEPLMRRLRDDMGIDFGFCTGTTGICDFFLNKANNQEVLDITFEHIYSGLRVKGYSKHPVEPLFLFPSEILRDVKIFFLKMEKLNIAIPYKELLEQAIRKLESKKILHSNCHEYYVFQDLREVGILENKQRIQSLLEEVATNSSDLAFKGLAALSLENMDLPAWWKLV